MARIGFCGLGRMGLPMATRLLDAGHEVVAWNRSKEKGEPLAARGATLVATPSEAVAGAELAITMVSDADALHDVVFGPDGVADGLPDGALLVEMSTIGPDAVRTLRGELRDDVDVVDAPVLGSVPQAEAGELQVFVGGSPEAFERARPTLEAVGSPRHVGELGAGAALKLAVNSTLAAVMVAVGEALALGRALGVDEQQLLEVLEASYVGGVIKSKGAIIGGGGGDPHFSLALAAKDLRLITEAAERAGIRLPTSEANRRTYEEASDQGLSDADYGAIIPWLRDR